MRQATMIARVWGVLAASLLALALAGLANAHPARRAASAQVTVTFTDTTLRVSPSSPQAGQTTFVVLNKGRKLHALVISGPGVAAARSTKVKPGGSTKLTLRLRPGAYELSDPVGLGAYNVQFLDIVPATNVTATGNSSVVTTPAALPPMCGQSYTP